MSALRKVVDLHTKPRAPNVREKLAEAERVLAALEAEVPELALAEAEGISGATAKLVALNNRISGARTERHKLRSALQLALEIDRRAEVAGRAKIRASQLAAMQTHSRERDAAVAEICDAAAKIAAAYQRYGMATQKLVGVRPIGTAFPSMAMGPNGVFGPIFGNLERLLEIELFRCSSPGADGQRFVVPLAKPMGLHSTDTAAIPPAIEVFREAQSALTAEIKEQLENLDAADLASVTQHDQTAAGGDLNGLRNEFIRRSVRHLHAELLIVLQCRQMRHQQPGSL